MVLRAVKYLLMEEVVECDSHRMIEKIATTHAFHSRALFYSLLNTVLHNDFWLFEVRGIHIGTNWMAKAFMLSQQCLQTLLLLLNHHQEGMTNVFMEYLLEVGQETFQVLLQCLLQCATLKFARSSEESMRSKYFRELLSLLYLFMTHHPAFEKWLSTQKECGELTHAILYEMYYGRKDAKQFEFVQFCTFLLLMLSGTREYGLSLNQPLRSPIEMDISQYVVTYVDLVILCFHKMMLDSDDSIDVLVDSLLVYLCNVSPYMQSISPSAVDKLMHLLKVFSSERFLYAKEKHHNYLFSLLDMMNNIVQYQYSGNHRFIYGLIGSHNYIITLINLSWFVPRLKSGHAYIPDLSKDETPEVEVTPEEVPPVVEATCEEGWKPSEAWLKEWHDRLPIEPIQRLLESVMPALSEIIVGEASDEKKVLSYLKEHTIVGVLPVPHPIVIRRFESSEQTKGWTRQMIHRLIYVHNYRYLSREKASH